MVLNYIWIAFFVIAFVVAVVQTFVYGNTEIWTYIMNASFSSARSAFDISLGLTGVLTLWLGLMKIGERLEERLENRMQTILRDRRHTLALYIERMKAVSPLEKLNSGFSYVEAADGKNIRSVTQVHEGDSLRIRVSDGVIDTKVEQVQQGDRFTV